VSEELDLTMRALEELYRSRGAEGWDLRVYDYTSNSWRDADEAFSTPGTYERAVLARSGQRPIRIRVLPPGPEALRVDPRSAGELAVWRALGLDLRGHHLEAIRRVLVGRRDPVPVQEVGRLLRADGGRDAMEAWGAISGLLSGGDGAP
jgi:hypothetical protein